MDIFYIARLLRKSVVLDDVVLDANGIPVAELDGSIPDVFQEMDNADCK